MQIRIAILVPKDLSKLAKKLAFDYSRLSKSYFWVDGKRLAHHITLFDILPSDKVLIRAEKMVLEHLRNKKGLRLLVGGIWKNKNGYLGLKVKNEKGFLNLRRRLFKELKNYKPQAVWKRNNTHITLTRYKDRSFPFSIKVKSPTNKKFYFNAIIFAKVDKHGQVYKIIKEFQLT